MNFLGLCLGIKKALATLQGICILLACLDILTIGHNGRVHSCLCSWAGCLSYNSAGNEDSELEAQDGEEKGQELAGLKRREAWGQF